MYEVEAEIVKGRVFLAAEDLINLCIGSVSENNTQFDRALKTLAEQIKGMENEARANTGDKNELLPKQDPDFLQTFI